MVATAKEGRLWSPGPGLTTLRGPYLPLRHHLSLPVGRGASHAQRKHFLHAAPLSAQPTNLSPLDIPLPICPPHLVLGVSLLQTLAKGGRMKGSGRKGGTRVRYNETYCLWGC